MYSFTTEQRELLGRIAPDIDFRKDLSDDDFEEVLGRLASVVSREVQNTEEGYSTPLADLCDSIIDIVNGE